MEIRIKRVQILYKKTGLIHYVYRDFNSTMCAIGTDEENWTHDTREGKRICKRCQVAAGRPARGLYNYGPMAWKRGR